MKSAKHRGISHVGCSQLNVVTLISTAMGPDEIRGLRERMQMSQQDFGRALGVSRVTVWKWETGRSIPQETYIGIMRFWREKIDEEEKRKTVENLLVAGGALSISALLHALTGSDDD
jgi:DNA-binding XRE family transcriptional regulator